MEAKEKKVKYPENLYLRIEVYKDPRTHSEIAAAIGFSREVLNMVINGKYKGTNVIPKLLAELANPSSPNPQN